jgi:hypothetical protein
MPIGLSHAQALAELARLLAAPFEVREIDDSAETEAMLDLAVEAAKALANQVIIDDRRN